MENIIGQAKASKCVMLIEPNPIVRMLLTMFLQREKHLLASHSSYEMALNALKLAFMECFPPHVVVISVRLKQRDCIHILAHLVHTSAYRETALVVLVLEEERRQRDMQRLLQMTQAQVLIKPVQVQDVLALVAASKFNAQPQPMV